MMLNGDEIKDRVKRYYWEDDFNCATTVLKTLAEIFDIDLTSQVIDSATGMHGAGRFGAQCGLVEGSLMFIGIFGKRAGFDTESITDYCYGFAKEFQDNFGSIVCRDLRPQGFSPDNPPHLCEEITGKAIEFTTSHIRRVMNI